MNDIPFKGRTADDSAPLILPVPNAPVFSDLDDPLASFVARDVEILVVEDAGVIVAIGGIRSNDCGQAEVLRVRVRPLVDGAVSVLSS